MKGRMRGKAYRGSKLAFGDYGLQARRGLAHVRPDRSRLLESL